MNDHFPLLHLTHGPAKRLDLVIHDFTFQLRRSFTNSMANNIRYLTGFAPAQLVVLSHNHSVKALRSHTCGMIDNRIIAISRYSDHSRNSPVFPLGSHAANG